MLTLPSMWNLIISTLVFFISAWYINRYLNEQGIPKGMTRGILVFMLASLAAWGAGAAADWAQETLEGPQPEAQTTDDLERLMKEVEKLNRDHRVASAFQVADPIQALSNYRCIPEICAPNPRTIPCK